MGKGTLDLVLLLKLAPQKPIDLVLQIHPLVRGVNLNDVVQVVQLIEMNAIPHERVMELVPGHW